MQQRIPVCVPCKEEEKNKMSNRIKKRKKSKKTNKDRWAESESDESEKEADRMWAKKLGPAVIKVQSVSR